MIKAVSGLVSINGSAPMIDYIGVGTHSEGNKRITCYRAVDKQSYGSIKSRRRS